MMLSAQQMRSLPDFFIDIPDPRRAQGRRHSLCPPCWPSPPAPSCVACAVTRRLPTGRKVSVPKPESDFAAVGSTGATWCPANRSFVMS